jgi:hypothetical protein
MRSKRTPEWLLNACLVAVFPFAWAPCNGPLLALAACPGMRRSWIRRAATDTTRERETMREICEAPVRASLSHDDARLDGAER